MASRRRNAARPRVYVRIGLWEKVRELNLTPRRAHPPPLGLEGIPQFRSLCVKAKDGFEIPVGSYAAVSGARGVVQIAISSNGFQPVLLIETNFEKETAFPSKRALQDARVELARVLDVPPK